jgi:hypothetical protein
MTAAVLIAGSVAATGGLAAIAVKISRVKNADDNHSTPARGQEDHHG